MKKLFFIATAAVLLFASTSVNAQIKVGGGLAYGSSINSIGISVNGEYAINEEWDAAAGFTYFFEKNYVSWSALDLDAHYTFTEIEGFGKLYGIAGLNMLFFSYNIPSIDLGEYGSYDGGSSTASSAGLNLGIGTKIGLSEKMTLAPEIKYALGNNFFQVGVKIFFSL